MRQTASGLNRGWLAVLGVLLILAGAAGVLISTGLWVTLAAAAGLALNRPTATSHVLGSQTTSFLGMTAVVVGVGVLGVILGLLGLAWLLAQIPRTNAAKAFRLHDDAATGLTVVEPGVLTHAVEHDLENLPGVSNASAVLRGTAAAPELTVKVTAHDRTDIQQLLASIHGDVAGNLSTAMDAPLKRLGVQVDIGGSRRTTDHVTL